jgi:hypothetical protein
VLDAIPQVINDQDRPCHFQPYRAFKIMYDVDQNGTKVLMCKEKHATRMFDVSTPLNFANACLMLVDERLGEGWYAQSAPYLSGTLDPLIEVFLRQLAHKPYIMEVHADLAPRDLSALWTNDDYQYIRGHQAIGSGALFQFMTMVVNETNEISQDMPGWHFNNNLVAFLGYMIHAINSDYDPALYDAMMKLNDRNAMVTRIINNLSKSHEERVCDLLEVANSNILKAGRLAFDFLEERKKYQYEHVEVETLEVASFEP